MKPYRDESTKNDVRFLDNEAFVGKNEQEAQQHCDIFRPRWVRKGFKMKLLKISRKT